MAGVIEELSVDIVEGKSAPEEEAPPSPPPTKGDVSDMNEYDFPSSIDIRAASTTVTPLDTLPPGTSFLLQNLTPLLTVEPMLMSSDFIGAQLRTPLLYQPRAARFTTR